MYFKKLLMLKLTNCLAKRSIWKVGDIIGLSVSLRKKYEDGNTVVYQYGDQGRLYGEFRINKESYEIIQLQVSDSEIDRVIYLSSVSKILKLIKRGEELPDMTSYNS